MLHHEQILFAIISTTIGTYHPDNSKLNPSNILPSYTAAMLQVPFHKCTMRYANLFIVASLYGIFFEPVPCQHL